MLDLLERAGELAGAVQARAFLAGGGGFAHDLGVQRARAFLRETIGLGAFRPLVDDDVDHLRDDVAGALDDDGIADADVAALAQDFAARADALDVVLVVQRGVLHDDAADADRLKLRGGREHAGAPDGDQHALHDGRRALGRELVRDRPARRTRDEARAAPASPAGRPCRRRRRCRSRAWRAVLRCRGGRRATASSEWQVLVSGLVLKPQVSNHLIMPDCVSAGISLISPQA